LTFRLFYSIIITEREREERKMTKAIYFDMDGTIANLYGVDGWLDMLINEDTTPYAKATPLIRLCTLARMLNRLQKDGWHIGIVSWLSKNGSKEYNNAVIETKLEWLANHMPSVEWNEIKIVEYGTPKSTVVNINGGILFDDEEKNRIEWNGIAYDVNNIIETLKNVA